MAAEILRPNANGDENLWGYQYPETGEHWDKVNEAIADDTGTYVRRGSADPSYTYELFNLPAPQGTGTINKITVYNRLTSTRIAGVAASIAIKTGGLTFSVDLYLYGTSWETRSWEWGTNPDTELAWTWADINALQIGSQCGSIGAGYYLYLTQVYVKVDYTPSVIISPPSAEGVGLAFAPIIVTEDLISITISCPAAVGGGEALLPIITAEVGEVIPFPPAGAFLRLRLFTTITTASDLTLFGGESGKHNRLEIRDTTRGGNKMNFDIGETITFSCEVKANGVYQDPSISMKITLTDKHKAVKADAADMTKGATGKYYYDCQTVGYLDGKYEVKYTATDGTRITIEKETFTLE